MALEILLSVLFALFGVVGLPILARGRTPTAVWIGGWMSAGMGGLLLLLAPELRWLDQLNYALGSFFPWLLLAGTCIWIGRPATASLVLAGFVYGGLRSAVGIFLGAHAAYVMALAFEPWLVLAAAALAWRYHESASPGFDGRYLAVSLVALAAAGVAHLLWLLEGGGPSLPLLAVWLIATPPLLGVQLAAGAAWMRRSVERSRDALELRVHERTRELALANESLRLEVAERRAAEEALRVTEERWRTVSELSSDLSFGYRLDGSGGIEVAWVTDAVERVTGFSPADMSGPDRPRIIHPDDREWLIQSLLLESGGERQATFRILCRDGGVRWLDARFRVRREPDGSMQVLGAGRDVTEARETEEARRRLEQQVQESQRLESLGLLSGGIAHDFNNLLTVILGNTRLALAELPEDAPLGQRLARIQTAAEHGAALTDQMVVYAGRGSHVRKPADLSRLLEDMLPLLRVSLPARCELVHEFAPGAWSEVDETQLRQVVLNLVANAGEALGDEAGRITLRTGTQRADAACLSAGRGAQDASPGTYAYVEVSDDGPGMDAATQRRIFDPFFTTRLAGRGVGLAAVLGIVRGHGGVVLLESAPGRGSRFRVLLPGAGQPLAASAPEDAPASPARGPSARVLLIDDEPGVLEVAAEFLAREGFDVVAVGSGREGLERFAAEPGRFEAAIVDLTMPDVSGEQVAAQLRARRPGLPLVLASGFSPELAAARCLELGDARFVRKPYAPGDLVQAVRGVLPQRQA